MPYKAETLVVGCGNILFKDDGFGPFVIKALEDYFKDKETPNNVMFVDAGTGASHYIFSLPDESWKKLIVIDAVEDPKVEPGTVKIYSPSDMSKGKYENPHTGIIEPLQSLAKDIEVIIVGCKLKENSAPDVEMGLTEPVEAAIPKAIEIILKEIGV
ncbi:coenzyme F420-reducing hydrogenase, FrhD protein [Methanobrevibacter curvatus]|uniref:Hydrogenase 2 maturation protease n=1 Tax=Methanobrevibacter curvatus TaxID=49547 RepID=A0A166B1X1_9EURY|nr:coenzyme F420-reducing hydrogenase, FrhD protein [Methanobrevibacter curvatus]KZX12759.1 hydrogenase 2 maturation protease [Methanobrevibacter curvatus]